MPKIVDLFTMGGLEQTRPNGKALDHYLIRYYSEQLANTGEEMRAFELYFLVGAKWNNPKDVSWNIRKVMNNNGYSVSRFRKDGELYVKVSRG